MKIKIKDWKELNGNHTEFVMLWVTDKQIAINTTYGEFIAHLSLEIKKEILLPVLKAFGFEIEFITEPTLTEEEWHQARVFKDGYLARDKDLAITYYKISPKRTSSWWERDGRTNNIPRDLFPFITWDSEPWSIEALRALKMEGEK